MCFVVLPDARIPTKLLRIQYLDPMPSLRKVVWLFETLNSCEILMIYPKPSLPKFGQFRQSPIDHTEDR